MDDWSEHEVRTLFIARCIRTVSVFVIGVFTFLLLCMCVGFYHVMKGVHRAYDQGEVRALWSGTLDTPQGPNDRVPSVQAREQVFSQSADPESDSSIWLQPTLARGCEVQTPPGEAYQVCSIRLRVNAEWREFTDLTNKRCHADSPAR